MAGTYTKKDFSAGPEEQTLLKDSNGTRIVPAKGNGIRMYSLMPPIMAMEECSFLGISFFVILSSRCIYLFRPVCKKGLGADTASLALAVKYLSLMSACGLLQSPFFFFFVRIACIVML